MNSTNPKPSGSQLQKWGLFVLLAGSLGFTLSMNPDHFNNIARNEGGSGAFDLASAALDAQADKANVDTAKEVLAEQRKKLEAELKKLKVEDAKIEVVLKSVDDFHAKKTPPTMTIEDVLKKSLVLADYPEADLAKAYEQITKEIPSLKAPEKKATKMAAAPAKQEAAALAKQEASAPAKQEVPAANADGTTKVYVDTKELADKLLSDEKLKQALINKLLPAGQQQASTVPATSAAPQNTNLTPDQQVAMTQAAQGSKEVAAPKAAPQQAATPAAGNPPQQHSPDAKTVTLMGTKGTCEITVDRKKDDSKKVRAVFNKKANESQACQLTEEAELTSSLGDIEGWTKELTALMNGKKIEVAKSEKDKEKDEKEKSKAEIAKEFWEKAAKRCKIKGMDTQEKLECYQDILVKLSNDLDDSNESKTILKKYFVQNILGPLKTLMSEPTTDPFTLTVDTSKLELGNDIAKGLLENLNGDNSEGITAMLASVKGGSYSAQATHAKNMFLSAQEDKKAPDFFTQQLGMRKEMMARQALNPMFLNWQLVRDRGEWMSSLSDGGKSGQASLLQSKFYQPVSSFLATLPKFDSYTKIGANNVNQAALDLMAMNIPDISGMGMNAANGMPPTLGTLTSGWPSNMSYESRINAPVRGGTIPGMGTLATQQTTTVNGKVITTPGGTTTTTSSPLRGGRRAAN